MFRTITDSCEPWLVWIIANLMRFVRGMEVNVTFKLPGAEDVSVKQWGTITNHLITGQTLDVAVLGATTNVTGASSDFQENGPCN